MLRTLNAFYQDDNGFIVSAELVLVSTIGVLAMVVGLSEVAVAVNTELNDFSNAIGALNQSYFYTGFAGNGCKMKSMVAGSCFQDQVDDCDRNTSCDLVGGAGSSQHEGNGGGHGGGQGGGD